jgi:hypothetical protein
MRLHLSHLLLFVILLARVHAVPARLALDGEAKMGLPASPMLPFGCCFAAATTLRSVAGVAGRRCCAFRAPPLGLRSTQAMTFHSILRVLLRSSYDAPLHCHFGGGFIFGQSCGG